MDKVLMVEPHTELAVLDFAKKLGITKEKAHYIENMRERYLIWEHDYLGTPKELD